MLRRSDSSPRPVRPLEFEKGVEEIFDVQIMPGNRYPVVVGYKKDTIHGVFVIPPEGHGWLSMTSSLVPHLTEVASTDCGLRAKIVRRISF